VIYVKYIINLILIIFLVSCASQEPAAEPKIEPSLETVTTQPVITPTDNPPEETDSIKETRESMTAESKEILGLSEKKVRNLQYTYYGPETLPAAYNMWVKGNKIKIELPKGNEYWIDQDLYKYVYVDRDAKTAKVVCDADSGACDASLGPQEIPFSRYGYIKTPLDWLDEVNSLDIISTENLQNREVYRAESNIGMLWLDTYTGLPLQIEKDGKTLLRAEGVVVNQVKDSDVNYE
jgi:hypothetical protein